MIRFLTGTGTGVGKTWITAALVAQLRAQGRPVRALKPLVSGLDEAVRDGLDDALAASDPGLLLQALGRPVTLDEVARVSPFRFREPLSPDMAARREGRRIDVKDLVAACSAAPDEVLLVEGVGGVMVPLNERETVLDWMAALAAPVVVVAGAYLGTLSHTLTAVEAVQRRGLTVQTVVVSESSPGPVPLEETLGSLRAHLDGVAVVGVPQVARFTDLPSLVDVLGPLG